MKNNFEMVLLLHELILYSTKNKLDTFLILNLKGTDANKNKKKGNDEA